MLIKSINKRILISPNFEFSNYLDNRITKNSKFTAISNKRDFYIQGGKKIISKNNYFGGKNSKFRNHKKTIGKVYYF